MQHSIRFVMESLKCNINRTIRFVAQYKIDLYIILKLIIQYILWWY